jgi:hypothetical protein
MDSLCTGIVSEALKFTACEIVLQMVCSTSADILQSGNHDSVGLLSAVNLALPLSLQHKPEYTHVIKKNSECGVIQGYLNKTN